MKNFTQLLLSLVFISLTASAAEENAPVATPGSAPAQERAADQQPADAHAKSADPHAKSADAHAQNPNSEHGESSQAHGRRQNDFYPRKKADKNLASRPEQVVLLEPKALSEISGGQVTLKWKPAQNAESYRLQVATDPNFKWIVAQEDFFKGTSYDLKGLEAGKQYYWRVFAWKTDNDASWSSSFATLSSFETK